MTRWVQEFDQHPFQAEWRKLLETATSLEVDDKTVSTTVEELARLKKALVFVDEVLKSADPELMPISILQSCDQQTRPCLKQVEAYLSNKQQTHLEQANSHADNLLTYVRPYMVAPEQALNAYGKAVRKFTDQVSGYAKALQEGAKETQTQLASATSDVQRMQKELTDSDAKIKQFYAYLFEGVGGSDPAEKELNETIAEIKKAHTEVMSLHEQLLTKPDSASAKIQQFQDDIKKLLEKLDSMDTKASSSHEELKQFYEQIFGAKVEGQDTRKGGLKQELEFSIEQLKEYEAEQTTRHETPL